MRLRLGQATAVGGVFFLVISVIMLALLNYAFYAYYSRAIELVRQVDELGYELLEIGLCYKYWSEIEGDVEVASGRVVREDSGALQELGDGRIISVVSRAVLNVSPVLTNLISNGEFEQGFSDWSHSGGWSIDNAYGTPPPSAKYHASLGKKLSELSLIHI